MATIRGNKRNNDLQGTDGADVIVALGGNDILRGNGGADSLRPGAGSDTLYGGAGDDVTLITELDIATPDVLDGGAGRDTLDVHKVTSPFFHLISWNYSSSTQLYSVSLFGRPADSPEALSFSGIETIRATIEDDQMLFTFSTAGLTIMSGAGNDWVNAGSGNDSIYGGVGDDLINGGDGRNQLYGGGGDDELSTGNRSGGLVDGGSGTDTLSVGGYVDLSRGFATSFGGQRITIRNVENINVTIASEGDVARGDDRNNVIDAGYSYEGAKLYGLDGADTVIGGDGNDLVFGGNGRDILDGGEGGADTLNGGEGADIFRFIDGFFSGEQPADTIADFSRKQGDRIDVSGIDANTAAEGEQSFRFIGTDAFSGSAGELRYAIRSGETLIQADTNGDGAADRQVVLTREIELTGADFILRADAHPIADFPGA